jgi:DNA topoisomerase-1
MSDLARRIVARYLAALESPTEDYEVIGHTRGQPCPNCKLPAFCEDCGLCEHCGFSTRQASVNYRIAARYKNKKKVETADGGEMTVYTYSERQIANRDRKKAERLARLEKSIGKLRAKVKRDLHSQDPEKTLVALAVALIDHTHERPGNDGSAGDGHFGVTGWKKKHVSFGKGGVFIKYVGKSGVEHKKSVSDATIKDALRSAYDAAEDDDASLFEWGGGSVTAEKVNKYLSSFDVTAKDLRGFAANSIMREKLQAVRKGRLPEDKKKREKQLKEEYKTALEETAEEIGHTPKMLEDSYLTPGTSEAYLKDGTVPAILAE